VGLPDFLYLSLSNILITTSTCGSVRYKRNIQNRKIQSKRVLGCDFFRKYQICRYALEPAGTFFFRWYLMILSGFFWIFFDFVVAQVRRYADTQIGVPAFSPLMQASSMKYTFC
jgi:hypothetical protein